VERRKLPGIQPFAEDFPEFKACDGIGRGNRLNDHAFVAGAVELSAQRGPFSYCVPPRSRIPDGLSTDRDRGTMGQPSEEAVKALFGTHIANAAAVRSREGFEFRAYLRQHGQSAHRSPGHYHQIVPARVPDYGPHVVRKPVIDPRVQDLARSRVPAMSHYQFAGESQGHSVLRLDAAGVISAGDGIRRKFSSLDGFRKLNHPLLRPAKNPAGRHKFARV